MSKKLIIIIAGTVVLLGGGAAVGFMMNRQPPNQEEVQAEPPGLVEMDPFLVNVNDPSGSRYAKLNVQLTIAPASVADNIRADKLVKARLRDRVLILLTSKTVEELVSPIGKEGFRRELKTHLGPLVEEGEIQDVLFTNFVVQ